MAWLVTVTEETLATQEESDGLPAGVLARVRLNENDAMVPDLAPVEEIRFENLARVNPQAAQGVMETKPGQPIDITVSSIGNAVSLRGSCACGWSCSLPPPQALSSAQTHRALTMLVRIMSNHSLKKQKN